VHLRGKDRTSYFASPLPPNGTQNGQLQALAPADFRQTDMMLTQWAEVAYFLRPVSSGATANGTPWYDLYRRQRLLAPNGTNITIDAGLWARYCYVSVPRPGTPTP